jgi:hypothetical protein
MNNTENYARRKHFKSEITVQDCSKLENVKHYLKLGSSIKENKLQQLSEFCNF